MNLTKYAPRLLGAAFLIVIITSAIGGTILSSVLGTGSISDILVNISNKLTLMHISILGGMLNSTAIVVLAVLLYVVLHKQNKIIALVALGLWLAEAIFYAIMQIGALALIPLSLDFVHAGAPVHSFYQTLGDFLYNGVYNQGLTIHMWFYCIGGILWYSLFYTSRFIPRVISLFGVIAASVGFVGILIQFFGYVVPIFVYLPIGVFEFIIAVWLMTKGIKNGSETL